MKCPICGKEMVSGFSIHPGLGGYIRVVEFDEYEAKKIPLLQAEICMDCGKIEFFTNAERVKEKIKRAR